MSLSSHKKEPFQKAMKAFNAMPKKSQQAFFLHLFRSKRLREEMEDLMDIAIGLERLHEPARPLEDILEERRRRRKKQ